MNVRSWLALHIGRLVRKFLHLTHRGGTSLPGKVALMIDPHLLENLASGWTSIIITGTNGKTLTTALTTHLLKQKYQTILTNPSGANMLQGIMTSFLQAPALPDDERAIAILEVDEGSLKHVLSQINAAYIVQTNLFEDQLDRYGSIQDIYELLQEAADMSPQAQLIINADSPLLAQYTPKQPAIYYGSDVSMKACDLEIPCPLCGEALTYKTYMYADLGNYTCPNCGFTRPPLSHTLNYIHKLGRHNLMFEIDKEEYLLNYGGLYNLYNALTAYTIARAFSLTTEQIRAGFSSVPPVQGRQEIYQLEDTPLVLNIFKNPVGLEQLIELIALDEKPYDVAILYNNHYADGVDTSWFEAADFSPLLSGKAVRFAAGGMQKKLVENHLKPSSQAVTLLEQTEDLISWAKKSEHKVYVLATVTAMGEIHKYLSK